jgi:AcrR family transcriptional regulator
MDPKGHREQAVKDAKCGFILAAAKQVFSEKGYLNARLEDIAAAAGFSKPSLYSYYQDKEAIFLSLAISEMQDVSNKIELAISSQGSFVKTLESILRIIFANFVQTFSYFSTAANFRDFDPMQMEASKRRENMERFHEIMKQMLTSIEKVIARARKAGEISGSQPTGDLAWFIISLIQSVHMRSMMAGKMCDVDSAIKQIIGFIMNGISAKTKVLAEV